MAYNIQRGWPVNPDAPPSSLEAKRPYVDNGTGIVDPSRYYSREWMEQENERLWPRVWLIAGVASDIPEDGDYFTFEIGRESILVARQADGAIRAFFNVDRKSVV